MMTLQHQIDLLCALRDGKALEYRRPKSVEAWRPIGGFDPDRAVNFSTHNEYRIKPEPFERWALIRDEPEWRTEQMSETQARKAAVALGAGYRVVLLREVI